VVEGQLVQFDDIRSPALMFGMATFTDLFPDLGFPAMKAAVRIDVFLDFLMAIKTEISLAMPVKTIVTFGTLMFYFGMPLDQGTRHDQ